MGATQYCAQEVNLVLQDITVFGSGTRLWVQCAFGKSDRSLFEIKESPMAVRPSSSFVYPTGRTTSTVNPKFTFDQYPDADAKSSNIGGAHSFTEPPPRIFALIIGINKYKNSPHIPELEGAVPDAEAVLDYLENHLGVPSPQIRILRNSEATRTAIIDGIMAFSLDPNIEKGDPILIYFAGHGDSADTPEDWKVGSTGKIELLVPYDHDSSLVVHNPKHGIPDRTIGALLSHVASIKGDNITVILDCCHSSSGTRASGKQNHQVQVLDPTLKVRAINVGKIPSNLDQDIRRVLDLERKTEVHSGFAHKGLRSHILLAACHSQGSAYERTSRGLFTVALLDTLVDCGINNLTYATLLSQMPRLSNGQSPQCEGIFIDRTLFNGKVSDKPRTPRLFYKIRKSEGEIYVIDDAGDAAGITVGTEFEVYKDQNSGDLLGVVVACKLSAFTTTLYAKESGIALEKDGVALKSRAGKEEQVPVYVADESLKDLVKKIDPNQIQLVERDQGAEFGMALEDGKVILNIYDSDLTKYGSNRMSHTLEFTFEAVSSVIRAAVHFYWHRRRVPHTRRGLANNVEIEVNELEEGFDLNLNSFFKPIPAGGNRKLEVGKDLDLQTETPYGWTIINKWGVSLYPALFYFDNGDWSITPYYEPPIAGDIVETPLKKNGQLSVGYGDSGWAAHKFYLREHQNVDVGVLKLFLAGSQVNLSHIAQSSPFVPGPVGGHFTAPSPPPFVHSGGRDATPSLSYDSSRATEQVPVQRISREISDPKTWPLPWDTVEVTVVQRRANK